MTRAAAIDIGTNTVLLLVAERGPDGRLHAVIERETITRLGEGVDASRRLSSAAVARTTACLDAYASDVRAYAAEKVGVVGTSAMRDAEGGDEVRQHVAATFGVEARVLSGAEEARLTYEGALGGLTRRATKEALVFDIGGGSTEVALGDASGDVVFARSLDIGSVRLTERHVRSDPPTADELDAIRREVDVALTTLPKLRSHEPIGIAGTMTTLASISLGHERHDGARVHGTRLSIDEVRRVTALLSQMPLAARRTLQGMEPLRADVLVAGGIIAVALLERLGASSCVVSSRGVRWGLAEELLG